MEENLTKQEETKQGDSPAIDEEMTSPEVTKEANGFSYKKFFIGLLLGILGIALILLLVFAYLFYKLPGKYLVVEKISATLHLPIASVSGHFISYNDFIQDYQTLVYYYNKQVEVGNIAASQLPADQQIKRDVINQLISKALVEQLAKQYQLSVSDIEIESYWQKEVVASFANEDEAVAKIKEFYNMTPEEFRQRVLKSNLLYDKVASAIEYDKTKQQASADKAAEVLAKVKSGEQSFEDLAKEYSEDSGSKDNGGDLGWFGRGVMVAEFEDAAFALAPGQVSDLIKTQYGYHIIKVEEKRGTAGDSNNPEEVHARHILISGFSLSSYLEEMKNSAEVKRYLDFGVE